MDPQADESRAAVLLAFANQAAPDIRRKLQRIERLGEQSIQDLVRAAEKVFNNRETPVKVKQYPMSQEAQQGITPHIQRLLKVGILKKYRSPWNTPLLPVKKPGGTDFRPVQDLFEVNKRVSDIHPTVPNPYTLLSGLPPDYIWYTILDLKDAFFSLPLAPQSQEIFAFEWTDEDSQTVGQLTWTRLP